MQHLFEHIQAHTACPVASVANFFVISAPEIGPRVKEEVEQFCARNDRQKWDGFALELPDEYGRKLETLSQTCRQLLTTLSPDIEGGKILSPEWEFHFRGIAFFVMGFGSCYGSHHSRQTYGKKGTLFLFHFMDALERRGVPRGEKPNLREKVAQTFQEKSIDYEREDIHGCPYEATRYILPADLSQSPVAWWEN